MKNCSVLHPLFLLLKSFCLKSNIKHSTHYFITRWNTSKFVKNTPLRVVFSTLFSVFHVIYQTWDAVFHHQMKHREESWKYDAQRSIFDELRGVSSGDETLCRMFDILHETLRLMLDILHNKMPLKWAQKFQKLSRSDLQKKKMLSTLLRHLTVVPNITAYTKGSQLQRF